MDPMDAMARLQLARALEFSGDTVKAKSAYDDLFTLWKNADPDIRVLKESSSGIREVAVIDWSVRPRADVDPVLSSYTGNVERHRTTPRHVNAYAISELDQFSKSRSNGTTFKHKGH